MEAGFSSNTFTWTKMVMRHTSCQEINTEKLTGCLYESGVSKVIQNSWIWPSFLHLKKGGGGSFWPPKRQCWGSWDAWTEVMVKRAVVGLLGNLLEWFGSRVWGGGALQMLWHYFWLLTWMWCHGAWAVVFPHTLFPSQWPIDPAWGGVQKWEVASYDGQTDKPQL